MAEAEPDGGGSARLLAGSVRDNLPVISSLAIPDGASPGKPGNPDIDHRSGDTS